MQEFIHSTANPSAPVAYCSFMAMHTKVELLFVIDDEERARELCEAVEGLFENTEKSMSRHLPGLGLAVVNSTESAVQVDDDLYFAIEMCEQLRRATGGYFDIAALSPTRQRPACRTYPPTHQVQRCFPEVILDLGGFAKGYALEKARTLLQDAGVQNALLNAGNSSVLGIGTHPLGDAWMVSPASDAGVQFNLHDSALSVSGRNGSGRDHIVDPKTGNMASKVLGIAVTGRSALVCEALSTALYAAPESEHGAIMAQFEDYEITDIRI